MNVEKIIRVLGYILYTALWSPILVLGAVILPIIWIALFVRAGRPIREAIGSFKRALIDGIRHDMEFIRTGEW